MNEIYIYRCFGSKENLFEAAFMELDEELYGDFRRAVQRIGGFEGCSKEKMYQFFLSLSLNYTRARAYFDTDKY
jgi:AcrR family transcriptional regulator